MKHIFKKNKPLALINIAQSAPLFIAIASAIGLLAYLWWPADSVQRMQVQHEAGWQQAGVVNPFGNAAPAQVQPSREPVVGVESPLSLSDTSLAGTQPDGDWGVNDRGQMVASRALRQRFDYYLSLIGELPLSQIHALVLHAAKQSLKEPALGQVMHVWERYVALQQHSWKHAVDLGQPASWGAALSERQIVRRHILGADVAYAFFSEEEGQLQQMLMQAQMGQPTREATSPTLSAALHPQAGEREAAVQLQWKQWEQRLSLAREKIGQLRQAPELSAVQRNQAIESYLSSQFQGEESIRARALLGM